MKASLQGQSTTREAAKCWVWVLGSLLLLGVLVVAYVISYPYIERGQRRPQYRARCKSQLKQIGRALHMYTGDHNDEFPTKLVDLVPKYLTTNALFQCPEEPDKEGSIDYVYVPGLSLQDRPDKVIACDKAGNHGREGRNVLFVDGHVAWFSEEGFQELMREQLSIE